MVTYKIKHLQNICKNVLEMVTCKIKHFTTFCIHGVDVVGSRRLSNVFANVLQMFYFTCNHGLTTVLRWILVCLHRSIILAWRPLYAVLRLYSSDQKSPYSQQPTLDTGSRNDDKWQLTTVGTSLHRSHGQSPKIYVHLIRLSSQCRLEVHAPTA